MFDQWMIVGVSASAVAAGLVAGVFLTFSDFVMRSLAAAQPEAGIEAMQEINRKVYRSIFMVLLMGLVPVSALLAVIAVPSAPFGASVAVGAGAALYFLGVFVVTAARNVPMNQRLDAMAYRGADARTYWPVYVEGWTRWNHVRTFSSAGSAALFLVGAVILGQS